jgi:hypothetical protein
MGQVTKNQIDFFCAKKVRSIFYWQFVTLIKYMKKILLSILFLTLLYFFVPQTVHAHFPATDKEIYAILHVDPNDSPIPGEQANLYFLITFGKSIKTFYLNQCNCVVTVTEEGKQIFQQQILDKNTPKNSIWGANVPFVFPQRDVYHIALSGKPLPGYTFQPFTVSWNFRVDEYPPISAPALQLQSLQKQQSDPTFVYFAIGFLGIIPLTGITLFFVIRSGNKKMNLTKRKPSHKLMK